MIIDTLSNADKYLVIHPGFTKAFEYIRNIDRASTVPGKYSIDDDRVRAIISSGKGMTQAASVAEFECHNQHIDIQYCIQGREEFGWKPRETCVSPNGGYDSEKDLQLFHDAPDMFFELREGQFVILFPEDVHAPMISDQIISKVVIKVKI